MTDQMIRHKPAKTSLGDETGVQKQRRSGRSTLATVVAMGVVTALAIYFLFPIYWVTVSATKTSNELSTTNGLLPSSLDQLVTNLKQLFTAQGGVFGQWMINSILYSVVGGAATTVVSAFAGYALAMLRFRARRVVSLAVLVGTMVPATVLAFPTYLVLVELGLVNTYWAILLPSLVNPLSVFLAIMFARQAVPLELLEAARIDGAGELRIAVTIASRLMLPGCVTILLIQVVAIWNNFFLPLIVLTNDRLYPATLGLYIWNSRITQDPDYQVLVIIGSIVSSIPLIVLFLTLQRYWRSGLGSGALKA